MIMGRRGKEKLTQEDYQAFYRIYIEEGKNIKATAKQLNASVPDASAYAKKYFLMQKKAKMRAPFDYKQIETFFYDQGKTAFEIAQILQCDQEKLQKWMVKNQFREEDRHNPFAKRKGKRMSYYMVGEVMAKMQGRYQKGSIFLLRKEKYLVMERYHNHLLARKFDGEKWTHKESFQYNELFLFESTGEIVVSQEAEKNLA